MNKADSISVLNEKIRTTLSNTAPFTYDVCIIGAGVAGCAMAWYLGNKGVKVLVIERDFSEPDKFIGELLQPGGVMMLAEMGMEDVLEGFDAQTVEGYALFMGQQNFTIPYPAIDGKAYTGRGFRYGKFIMSLREKMAGVETVSLIEGSANTLNEDANGTITGVNYQAKGAEAANIDAHLTIVCDGSFSKFRKELNQGDQKIKGFMVGLLLDNFDLPHPGHGHVILTGETPVLSYPVSSTKTRVLVDFPGEKSPKQGGKAYQQLVDISRNLPESMQAPYLASIDKARIKAMPNMMVTAKPVIKPGAIMLGDALNMRHPLTGGGMTVALTDVQLLGSLLHKIDNYKNTSQLNKAIETFYFQRHQASSTINILADALYEVMSSPDLKKACYDYLNRGHSYSKGPVSILSAVSRDRDLLLKEFFAVAMFGVGNLLKPFPGPKSLLRSYHLMQDAVHIISPLLMNEKPSLSTRMALKVGELVFPEKHSKKSASLAG